MYIVGTREHHMAGIKAVLCYPLLTTCHPFLQELPLALWAQSVRLFFLSTQPPPPAASQPASPAVGSVGMG